MTSVIPPFRNLLFLCILVAAFFSVNSCKKDKHAAAPSIVTVAPAPTPLPDSTPLPRVADTLGKIHWHRQYHYWHSINLTTITDSISDMTDIVYAIMLNPDSTLSSVPWPFSGGFRHVHHAGNAVLTWFWQSVAAWECGSGTHFATVYYYPLTNDIVMSYTRYGSNGVEGCGYTITYSTFPTASHP